MKSQMIHTRSATLGAFLTLVLLSSPRREAMAGSGSARCESSSVSASLFAAPITETVTLGELNVARRPISLGPFLTLILNARQNAAPAYAADQTLLQLRIVAG